MQKKFSENKMRKTIKTLPIMPALRPLTLRLGVLINNTRMFRALASTFVIVIVVVVVLGVATARKANAQGTSNNNNGNPILAAVEQVQITLTALQSSLATLQSSVASLVPPAASKVRFTPLEAARVGDGIGCEVVNVAGVPRNVQVQMINPFDGTVVLG